ncbi:MAG: NUDIX domain-containing protein, partial [Thermomicrobiales bacterium]
ELFDVLDADGQPTGVTKRRAEIHRGGDWHRAVHIWVYGLRNREPFLLFQRRSSQKDTSPGRLDATVGGHFGAGETIEDVWREVQEELGIPAIPGEMRFAGVRVRSNETRQKIIDREIQEVYLWRRDQALCTYRPNPVELAGLVEVRIADVLPVFTGEVASFKAMTLDSHSGHIRDELLNAEEILPSVDRYPFRVAVAVLAALRGDKWIAV